MFEEERKYSRHYRCKCEHVDKKHKYDECDNYRRDRCTNHRHDRCNNHNHYHHNSIYDAKCLYRCVQQPSNVMNNCNNYYNCGCECDYYSMIIFNSDRGSVRQV